MYHALFLTVSQFRRSHYRDYIHTGVDRRCPVQYHLSSYWSGPVHMIRASSNCLLRAVALVKRQNEL